MTIDNTAARRVLFAGFDDVQRKLVATAKAFKAAPTEAKGLQVLTAYVKDVLVPYLDTRKDDLIRSVVPEIEALIARVAELETEIRGLLAGTGPANRLARKKKAPPEEET
jgi:hypothetical protein